MTEKRFIRIKNENGISIKDTKTGYERYYAIEVLDDLNELSEENEQLRNKLECCEYKHLLKELDEIHEKYDDYILWKKEKDKHIGWKAL